MRSLHERGLVEWILELAMRVSTIEAHYVCKHSLLQDKKSPFCCLMGQNTINRMEVTKTVTNHAFSLVV